MKALSIRQPWAWAIIRGHKTLENRTWYTSYRGPLVVHASGSVGSAREFELNRAKVQRLTGVHVPDLDEMTRGGIVGVVELVDVVEPDEVRVRLASGDAACWHARGCFAWLLERARAVPFRRMSGRLGLFEVGRIRGA